MPRIHGLYDDPNSQFEIWGTPNENPFAEFGDDFSLSGSASGQASLGPGGASAAGQLLGSAGGGAPAPQPSGPSGPGFWGAIRNYFAKAPPPRPVMRRPGVSPPPRPPSPALIAAMMPRRPRGNPRAMLLEPNKGSSVAVERFVFGLEDQITALATPQTLDLSDTPDTVIRPQRVTANAPSVGFVLIQSMRVGNVDVSIGSTIDAFEFNANAQGSSLDMPTLKTSTKVRIAASYTGLVPSPLSGTGAYTFTVSFKGPSTLTP